MSVKKNLLLLILSLSVTILFLGNINLISADTTSSAVSTSSSIASSTATSSSSTTSSASASSSSSSSTTVFSSGIKWPTTSFAPWTRGKRESKDTVRNYYGFMINNDNGQYIEEYEEGKVITTKQYWSTSKREGYNKEADIKIYIQGAKKGRDISSIGLDEAEVLYERNSHFKILYKVFTENCWQILVEEM